MPPNSGTCSSSRVVNAVTRIPTNRALSHTSIWQSQRFGMRVKNIAVTPASMAVMTAIFFLPYLFNIRPLATAPSVNSSAAMSIIIEADPVERSYWVLMKAVL